MKINTAFFVTACILAPVTAVAIPSDYWQQEVNYRLKINLASDLRTITGAIDIEYINNSPDSLGVLYLKAFPNAIQNSC